MKFLSLESYSFTFTFTFSSYEIQSQTEDEDSSEDIVETIKSQEDEVLDDNISTPAVPEDAPINEDEFIIDRRGK